MTFLLSSRLLKQLASKAAANYRLLGGGWDDSNCARPPSTALSCAVREHGNRPSYPAPCFSSHQVVTC
jgi:hypothetical protein